MERKRETTRTRPVRPTRDPETTKEIAAVGAERAADTLEYAKEEGGKQAKRVWRNLRRLPKRVQKWPATHGRPQLRRSPRMGGSLQRLD